MPELKDYTVTANDLQKLDIPDINWVVPDLIPEGLTLLAGRPKIGKSRMALNLAFSISQGLSALGRYNTIKSTVLYIAYEDNARRIQERLNQLCDSNNLNDAPSNLHFIIPSNSFPKLNDSGLELIDGFIKDDLLLKCVIIDTFGSAIKNDGRRYGYSFQQDYELGSSIQNIALQNQVAFILLHHTRKMKSGDPYEDIVGTTGLTASPDTLFVLEKNPNGNLFTLSVNGRDVIDTKLSLELDKETSSLIAKDDLPEYHTTKERQDIINLFDDTPGLILRSGEIAEKIGKKSSVTSRLLKKLLKDEIILNDEYGSYRLNKPIEEETKIIEPIQQIIENPILEQTKTKGKINLNL